MKRVITVLVIISCVVFLFLTAEAAPCRLLPQRILVIASTVPDADAVCVNQTFKQLGVFWKIPIDIVQGRDVDKTVFFDDQGKPKYCLVVVSLGVSGLTADDFRFDKLRCVSESIPLLAMYKTALLGDPDIEALWGVKGINNNQSLGRFLYNVETHDEFMRGVAAETPVNNSSVFSGISVKVADAKKLVYHGSNTLVTRRGMNVYIGAHPRQLGQVTFPAFFKIIENIILESSAGVHFAVGEYTSLRMDDYPSTTQMVALKKDRFSAPYIKRIIIGFVFVTPWITVLYVLIFLGLSIAGVLRSRFFWKYFVLSVLSCLLLLTVQHRIVESKYNSSYNISMIDSLFYCGHDFGKSNEISNIHKVFKRYATKIEYMITSHILMADGTLVRQDELFPLTVKKMARLFRNGDINVNAHGRSHVREDFFIKDGKIDSCEYCGLNSVETKAHIEDTIRMVIEVFGKNPTGFVAPAWGYEPGVTKKIAASYFAYLVDKNSKFLSDENIVPFGVRDSAGYLEAVETWEYGMKSGNETDGNIWRSYAELGLPIHFMMHSPTCDTQRGDIVEICRAGFLQRVRWLFLEDLVRFVDEFNRMDVTKISYGNGSVSYIFECPVSISQEFRLFTRDIIKTVKLDGKDVAVSSPNKVWIPQLARGGHELVVTYSKED